MTGGVCAAPAADSIHRIKTKAQKRGIMNTQKKGSFSRWSGNSAEWYEAASKYTRYHEKLKTHIAPYLNPKETCCEPVCGAERWRAIWRPHRPVHRQRYRSQLAGILPKLQNQEPVANLEFLPETGEKSSRVKIRYGDLQLFQRDLHRLGRTPAAGRKKSSPSSRVTALTRSKRKESFRRAKPFWEDCGRRLSGDARRPAKTRTAYTQISDTAAEKISDTPGDTKKNKKQTEKRPLL